MLRKSRYYFLLGFMLVAAAVLRFYDLGRVSLTADELSALERLHFSSFGEMLEQGVKPDGHPAFAQVLLWFSTKTFGVSAFAIRFPFALASLFAIWFAAAVARRWFGDACALMTAAILAFCEFPLMYSQLARPYAFGLFFCMGAVFFWNRILFDEARGRKWHVLLAYALFTTGAMYTHYFSFLFVALVGVTGLFLLSKTNRGHYLLAGAAALLLFIPHLGFTKHQFSIGGVGGGDAWLAPPEPSFISDHIAFVFNNSWIVGGAALLAIAVSVFLTVKRRNWNKFYVIAFAWFIIPLVVGYMYSVYRSPVLQHSVLLFSMPFLLMFLFSGLRDVHNAAGLIVIPFALIPAGSTVLEKKYALTNHFGRVNDLVTDMKRWSDTYGEKNMAFAGNYDGAYFPGFYFDQLNWHPKMLTTFIDADHPEKLYDFRQLVQTSNADYFAWTWSTKAPSQEAIYLIREKYPYIAERNYYYNSESWLFARNPVKTAQPNDTAFVLADEINLTLKPRWKDNLHTVKTDSLAKSGSACLVLQKPDGVYGPVFTGTIGTEVTSPNDYISVEADVRADSGAAPIAVIEFKRGDELLLWTGREFAHVHHTTGTWNTFFYSVRMYKELRKGDTFRIYFFNDRDAAARIDNVTIRTIRGSTVIYGKVPNY